ncbi:MAG TPA: CDP-alcohol phosphatidyltransferase family protein, partial [Aliiroseovarius sp.]|nr:CDP-alcohol phosphatidyltransferase family protein [Aliiroseovarius sp.]
NGSYPSFFIAGLFFVLLNILDAADGELARYTGKTSDFGDYLDRVAHYATNSAAVLGVGIGLFFLTGQVAVLYVMVVLEISIVLDDAMRDLLMACGLDRRQDAAESRKEVKQRSRLHVPRGLAGIGRALFSGVAFFHILPLAALAGWGLGEPRVLLWYYELFALVTFLKAALRVRGILGNYA